MNGIPVIASKSGGLPEAVNGGGICLDAPEECTKNKHAHFPTEDEMMEWFKALEEMMDDTNYANWQAKAKEASTTHDIEKNTDRLLKYLNPFLNRRASFHPQYLIR